MEGSPESEDLAASHPTEPLVEGGTVLKRALIALAAAIVVALPSAPAATPKLPHRIISLSPTATETLFAIGAGKQVIAVDDQSDYPKRAPRTKLSGYTPNVEAIAKYKPDLVVIANDVKGLRASLRKLHIKVVLQPAANDLAGAYDQMRAPRRPDRPHRPDEPADPSLGRADPRGDLLGAEVAAQDLPRARPDPVLGEVEHVHRPGLRALRARRTSRTRRPARRIRSSRPSTSSRRTRT